jgi:hypothetical protein
VNRWGRACANRAVLAACYAVICGTPRASHAEPGPVEPAKAAGAAGYSSYVVLRFAASAGRQLGSDERREALSQALIASANESHVLICYHGAAGALGGTALDPLCAAPSRDMKELWWDAAIAIHRAGKTTATCSLQLALGQGPPKQAPAFFLTPPVVLQGKPSAADAESAALREVSAQLAGNPALAAWFRKVAKAPGQLHAQLAKVAPQTASSDTTEAPRRKMMIEGPSAAPADSGGATAGGVLAPSPAAAAPAGPAADTMPPPVAVPPETTFAVRQAAIGQGFSGGHDGFLRIGGDGLTFSRTPQGPVEWTIRWRDLVSATRDDGLWDAPFPLALTDKGAKTRYVARIDYQGRFLDGGALLAAIARGRELARSAARPAATPR